MRKLRRILIQIKPITGWLPTGNVEYDAERDKELRHMDKNSQQPRRDRDTPRNQKNT
jgi:hypothetical protein